MRVAVTGAYGYSGQYMARRLLEQGHEVLSLTNSTQRSNPFGRKVKAQPFNFSNPALLEQTLRGVNILINNYWVRFDLPPLFTHANAVLHAKTLFEAAKRAGVTRIVHISITNPDRNSDLPYFSGKAEMEDHLRSTGLSHCILRPTVLFGREVPGRKQGARTTLVQYGSVRQSGESGGASGTRAASLRGRPASLIRIFRFASE